MTEYMKELILAALRNPSDAEKLQNAITEVEKTEVEKRGVDAKKAVSTMSDYVNNMCHDPEEFVALFNREHRTLQQSFTGLCFAWIVNMSKQEFFDGRNEASVQKCKELLKGKDVKYDLLLPFI